MAKPPYVARAFSALLASAIFGCGSDVQDQNEDLSEGFYLADAAPKPENPDETLQKLKKRNQDEAAELALLLEVNKRFCVRLKQLREDCVAAVRLIPGAADAALKCNALPKDSAGPQNGIRATIGDVPGEFILIADKNYESSVLTAGTMDVKFTTTASKSTNAPRLMDLTSLRLKAKNGPIPSTADLGFELFVNDLVLFSIDDFLPADSADPSFLRINPERLNEFRKSPTCSVSSQDVQGIVDQTRKDLAQSTVQKTPDASSDGGKP